MWKVFVFLAIVVVLGSIIPIIQFCFRRKPAVKDACYYSFSQELFDREFGCSEVNYDLGGKDNASDDISDRRMVATRGWVRGAIGSILPNSQFEQNKKNEYDIELP